MRYAIIQENRITNIIETVDIQKVMSSIPADGYAKEVTGITCKIGDIVSYGKGSLIISNPALEEAIQWKLEEAHSIFVTKRDSIVWVDTSQGRLGFVTCAEDIVNFMSARVAAELQGSSGYRAWINHTDKGWLTFTKADFDKVFDTARRSQLSAYDWFTEREKQIKAAKSIEELDKIVLEGDNDVKNKQ